MYEYTNCPFRQKTDNRMICGLAKSIIKSEHNELYVINDETCSNCYKTREIPDEKKINTVVAGVLLSAIQTILKNGELEDFSEVRARKLLDYIQKIYPKCNCGQKPENNKPNKPILERIIGNVR